MVLIAEMPRATGAEVRQQKEKTASWRGWKRCRRAVEVDGSEAVVLEAE